MKQKDIREAIENCSNYGLIYAEDLDDLAKEINVQASILQKIALDMGYNVQGFLEEELINIKQGGK